MIDYLREQNVADLDAWLDADQRTELCMLRSMLELDFYFLILYFRWQTDAGWAGYRGVIEGVLRSSGAPGLLLPLILRHVRKSAVAQYVAQGTGKRELDENLAHAREIFGALARLAARHQGPWWFGAKPSSADAIVHAFVGHAIVPRMGLPLEARAADHPRLRECFDRVHARVGEANAADREAGKVLDAGVARPSATS